MARTPTRIQRKRTRGWRAPDGSFSCTRPGLFGNPFTSAASYRLWLLGTAYRDIEPERRERLLLELPGLLNYKHLMCWCDLEPKGQCHVDVLIELLEALA